MTTTPDNPGSPAEGREKLIEMRILLREYDELQRRYKIIPPTDPGLLTLVSIENKLIGFVRELVAANV